MNANWEARRTNDPTAGQKRNPLHLDALSEAIETARQRHITDGVTVHVYVRKGTPVIRVSKPKAARVWTFSGGDMLLRIRDVARDDLGRELTSDE